MNPFVRDLRLQDLPEGAGVLLRMPSSTRPALWLIRKEGIRLVVKDYSVNRFCYRHIIGRFLVWREAKAYRRLKNMEGVPRLYRIIDGIALVMVEIQGRSVEGLEEKERLPSQFFVLLRELVEKVHERGLAHCDLKRAPNILAGDDGKPYLVDWSAAISKREFGIFPLTGIYKRFLRDDLNAVLKLQLRHFPEGVSREEMEKYSSRSKTERGVRWLRDKLRALLQRVV